MSVCTWSTNWIWNAFSDCFWRLFPLKNVKYLSPGKLHDISLHFSGDKLNMFSAWCYKTITYILIALIQRDSVYTSIYRVWHIICSKGQSLIFHIQMWLLESIWLSCTWNWDSFLKCHKDVLKILSYNASDYFLKH